MDNRFDTPEFGFAWASLVSTLRIHSGPAFSIALHNSETSAARERALRRRRARDDAMRERAIRRWSSCLLAALASGDSVVLAYISPAGTLEYLQGHVRGHRRGVWSVQAVSALGGVVHRIRPERIAALQVGAGTEPMHVQW